MQTNNYTFVPTIRKLRENSLLKVAVVLTFQTLGCRKPQKAEISILSLNFDTEYMRFSISNKPFNKLAGIAAALMILPVAVACDTPVAETTEPADTTEMPADTAATPTGGDTIVDVAASNGSFNTLVSAIQSAGLAETLSGEGPFTVFAPTDEAFDALPEGVLDKLLLPENQEVLTQILTYHVLPAEVPSSEISPGMVATVEGEDVDIAVDGSNVTVNGATVAMPDVMASNGVIHVIDSVLVPPTVDVSAL